MSNQFSEVFAVELHCWCHGLSSINERVEREALLEVIREFAPVMREAIENEFVFDPVQTAKDICVAANHPEMEREIAYYMLSLLPFPTELNEAQAKIEAEIVEIAEAAFAGTIKRLEQRWKRAQLKPVPEKKQDPFAALSFPKGTECSFVSSESFSKQRKFYTS